LYTKTTPHTRVSTLFQRTPPPKTAYHLRGGPEYRLPENKTAFPFFAIFAYFTTSSFKTDSGKMKTDFKNPREVFLSSRDEEQKPLSVFATVLRAGRIEAIFEALFSRFSLFRYSPDFAGAVTASWRRIWENRRRFLSRTCPSTITSFIFFPGVIVEEKQTSVRTPFSQKTGPSFMADSSRFVGFVAIFGRGG
jgi:hypothetical protein